MGKKRARSSPSYGSAKKKKRRSASSSSSSSRPKRRTRKRSKSKARKSSSASSPDHKRRRRRHRSGRSNAAEKDTRGDVKLFVGRLPREVTRQQLQKAFEAFGPVLEVFIIGQKASNQLGCAFVRLPSLEQAQKAIQELHEKPAPESSFFNPLQVTLAKGEAERLGLPADGIEGVRKTDLHQLATSASMLPVKTLVDLVKEGQRKSAGFKQRWQSFCEFAKTQGVKSSRPSKHSAGALAHFVGTVAFEYGSEIWFRSKFDKVPPRTAGMMGGAPPFLGAGPPPPGMGPPPGPPPGPPSGPPFPFPPPRPFGGPHHPPTPHGPHGPHGIPGPHGPPPPWGMPWPPGIAPPESNIFRPPTAMQSGNIFRPWGPPPGVQGGPPPIAVSAPRQRGTRSPSPGAEISDSSAEDSEDSEEGFRPGGKRDERPPVGLQKSKVQGHQKHVFQASEELSTSDSANEDVDIALV